MGGLIIGDRGVEMSIYMNKVYIPYLPGFIAINLFVVSIAQAVFSEQTRGYSLYMCCRLMIKIEAHFSKRRHG